MENDEWELVSFNGPFRGVKRIGKKEYYGMLIETTVRNKASGTVKTFTEMTELHRIIPVEQNKYTTKGEVE